MRAPFSGILAEDIQIIGIGVDFRFTDFRRLRKNALLPEDVHILCGRVIRKAERSGRLFDVDDGVLFKIGWC